MPVPPFHRWPTCDSELLRGIIRSLRSRSKSLKNRTQDFFIEVVPDSTESRTTKLNLELRNWSPHPDRIAITIWSDGTMRLDARRASKSGWDYEFSLAGNCRTIEADEIRDMIERSLWIQCPDEMRDVWSLCKLEPE